MALGRLGIRPREFWTLTPGELSMMADGAFLAEAEREKAEWRRTAWLAAQIINISGKVLPRGRRVRMEDLIPFDDGEGRRSATPVDMEKRRQEAEETFRRQKLKCWTKIKGASVEDIKLERWADNSAARPDDKSGDAEKIIRFIQGK